MLNYLNKIILFDIAHMMAGIVDLVGIGMVTPRIDNGCSLEKEFIELISMNS